MAEFVASLLLASVLGFATASLLYWLRAGAAWLRVGILVLIPPGVLFAVFLAFFDGAPIGEDWVWLGVGLVYFWPWYLAWCVGCVLGRLVLTRKRTAAG